MPPVTTLPAGRSGPVQGRAATAAAGSRGAAERLPALDALRGIAASAVLVFHLLHVIGSGGPPAPFQDGRLAYILTLHSPLRPFFVGREAVLFFFVLSGYVLTRSLLRTGSPGLLAFAAQRSIRLGLPVAASVLLSAGLCLLLVTPEMRPALLRHSLGLWSVPLSLGQVARDIGLFGGDSDFRLNLVLWSLVHEWRLTLLLPLVLACRTRPWMLLALGLLGMAVGAAAGAAENVVCLGPGLRSSLPATLYFSAAIASGAALAMVAPPPMASPGMRRAAFVAALALMSLQSDIAVYAASALLILLAQAPGRFAALLRTAPLVWLGGVSFSLYLIHMPVLVGAVVAMPGLPVWAAALMGAAAALPAAAVLHRWVEVPSRRLARRAEAALA